MDYVFFSTLRGHHPKLTDITISYDIGCQWSRNFWTRMKLFPRDYHIDHDSVKVKFLVPKFHLPAHRPACQSSYSFNFAPHVGRTDGEAPERGWSNTNALSSSTKEMGPGSRRDTLDDHFGDMNWKKICGLGLFQFIYGLRKHSHMSRCLFTGQNRSGAPGAGKTTASISGTYRLSVWLGFWMERGC
jgi:hypothetical protein